MSPVPLPRRARRLARAWRLPPRQTSGRRGSRWPPIVPLAARRCLPVAARTPQSRLRGACLAMEQSAPCPRGQEYLRTPRHHRRTPPATTPPASGRRRGRPPTDRGAGPPPSPRQPRSHQGRTAAPRPLPPVEPALRSRVAPPSEAGQPSRLRPDAGRQSMPSAERRRRRGGSGSGWLGGGPSPPARCPAALAQCPSLVMETARQRAAPAPVSDPPRSATDGAIRGAPLAATLRWWRPQEWRCPMGLRLRPVP